MSGLEIAAFVCAAIPAALFVRNLSAFRVAPRASHRASVSVLAARDPRVRLETAPPLPAGWCGKQHACFALSRLAVSYP